MNIVGELKVFSCLILFEVANPICKGGAREQFVVKIKPKQKKMAKTYSEKAKRKKKLLMDVKEN